MDLRIFTEPQQGASYDQLLRLARATEDAGYDAFFRSDHYLAMGGDGRPGPTDAWITLAGLARETSRIGLGTMVTAATFRLPSVLAISVAQVDAMSGGRVELGLGTGWFEAEHSAYGIPFPPVKERFDRLEEQLEIVTGLWAAPGRYSFAGRHYRLVDAPGLPKPVQSPLPVIVGGAGRRRTPALAARFAAEFNVPFRPSAQAGELYRLVRDAGAAAGRTAPMTFSAAQTVCCGRDEAEYRKRAEAIGRDPADLRANGVAGTVAEVVDAIGAYAAVGATRMYLQTLDVDDLDHIELIAAEVAPQLPV
ncbi:MAG TPA: LLM class F420-dependent oxidoreductase [Mycobacteriales bacterium]|nr:LLM class F420-dependent oxidoreductase [Mycobacteriales bacterium]